MMKVVHKTEGGSPVEIARKNWEAQKEKTVDEWEVVHEGNPIVLLRRKPGTDEFEEEQLYDLELSDMLMERHAGEYKIIDYQDARLKPVVPINREKLGEKYLRHFNLWKEKPRSNVSDTIDIPLKSSSNSIHDVDGEEMDFDTEDIDLNEALAEEYPEAILPKGSKLDVLMRGLMVFLLVDVAFLCGYFFRSTYSLTTSTFQNVLFVSLVLVAFVLGYFTSRWMGKRAK